MAAARLVMLGVAIAAAGGAGYVAKFMAPSSQVEVSAPAEPAVALSDVLVVTGDVKMGDTLGDRINWQSWPDATINDKFITRTATPEALEEMKSSVARVALYAGEPVRKSKLIGGGQPFMSAVLPAGHRAVATTVAADTSAGGFILPNDYVDVIMVRRGEGGSGPGGFITETILENIRVLAIDQAVQEDEEGKKVKVGSTATLELTPQQAEIITAAQQMADRLTLSLRAIVDTHQSTEEAGAYLVSGKDRRGTIRLIKSGQVSEVGARQ